jgi:uncharacterized membrane protein
MTKQRYEALDVLRGMTMVIMALDHSRDFLSLGYVFSSPLDLDVTNFEVFMTRWITHFAAPVFIFLAGIGLYFASSRRTKSELAFLALSRGIWLILLELSLVAFFWSFSSDFYYKPKVAVLFAIGVSMIFMAFLVYLPKWLIAIISLSLVFGHNAFDSVDASYFGEYAWIWHLLHQPGTIHVLGLDIRVIYSFIPWIGVMALGYLFGPVTKMQQTQRKKIFLFSGAALLIAGIVLRTTNLYGEANLYEEQDSFIFTLMSFLNVTKYPPSLLYLFFMLGIAMLMMGLFDRKLASWSKPFEVFGRVPFFFYILHIPLLHIFGIILALYTFNDASWLMQTPVGPAPKDYSYTYELLPTYLAWIAAVVLLYKPSKWFANIKANRKDWWLSYF